MSNEIFSVYWILKDEIGDAEEKARSMKDIFEKNFNGFMGLFSNIEYVDMEVDYETFCKNNKN
jgi:hypothetical protein